MNQAMHALGLANDRRYALADLKKAIRAQPKAAGVEMVLDVLYRPTETTGAIRIDALLLSIRQFGDAQLRSVFMRAGVYGPGRWKRLRELTDRQREALAEALEGVA